MATLSASKRKKLPAAEFGLPGKRAYPMPDAAHAVNAKARATQQVNAGNLAPATAAKIEAKANRFLANHRGNRTKARNALARELLTKGGHY